VFSAGKYLRGQAGFMKNYQAEFIFFIFFFMKYFRLLKRENRGREIQTAQQLSPPSSLAATIKKNSGRDHGNAAHRFCHNREHEDFTYFCTFGQHPAGTDIFRSDGYKAGGVQG
jgi:hypothetical protein